MPEKAVQQARLGAARKVVNEGDKRKQSTEHICPETFTFPEEGSIHAKSCGKSEILIVQISIKKSDYELPVIRQINLTE